MVQLVDEQINQKRGVIMRQKFENLGTVIINPIIFRAGLFDRSMLKRAAPLV